MNIMEQVLSTPAYVGWMGLSVVVGAIVLFSLQERRRRAARALGNVKSRRAATRAERDEIEGALLVVNMKPGVEPVDRLQTAALTKPSTRTAPPNIGGSGVAMWSHDAPTTVFHFSTEMRERARRERNVEDAG